MSTDLYLHAVSGITEEALLQMRLDDRWPNLPDTPRCFGLETEHPLWPKIEKADTFRHRLKRDKISTRHMRIGESDRGYCAWIGHVDDFRILMNHVVSLEGPIITPALIDWFAGVHEACLAGDKHEQPGFNSREFRRWLRTRLGSRLFARVD